MKVTPEMLKTFPVLAALPDNTLSKLAEQSGIAKYARRAVVLDPGKAEGKICFLFEGRLQGVDFTIDGKEVGLYFIEPGNFCGELQLYDSEPLPEFIIALAPSLVVQVPAKLLATVMQDAPGAATIIGNRLAKRIRQLTRQRSLLSLPNVAQRVCCQLWLLIPVKEREGEGEAVILNPPTHMELAIMLNLSRESVTRVFQTLQNRQIVKRDGPYRLLIQNLATLRELAGGKSDL